MPLKHDDKLLEHILSPDLEIASKALDEAGDVDPIPTRWAKPLVVAYLDRTKSESIRERILWLIDRLPEPFIVEALRKSFEIDSEYFSYVTCDDDFEPLNTELASLAPNYEDFPLIKKFIEEYIEQEISGARKCQASFEGVSSDAHEWLENPDAIPSEYDIPGKCATCLYWVPLTIAEGGVLGDCSIHSADVGLFRQDVTCEQWTKRNNDNSCDQEDDK